MRKEDWPQQIVHAPNYGKLRVPGSVREKPTPWQHKRAGMDPNHLVLIRQLPCTVCENRFAIEAHHLKSGAARKERSFGVKATDRWALPLGGFHTGRGRGCEHHDEVERIASIHEPEWFAAYGINPHFLALALWTNTGCIVRMARVLEAHKRDAIRQLARVRAAGR